MLMTLPEPTSPQDDETIHLNLWFELTIVIFPYVNHISISKPSTFTHYRILEIIIITHVKS